MCTFLGMIDETELEELRDHFKKNNRVKEYGGHSHKIHTLAWNCDGRRLASGSFDKTVCVFQMDRDKLVRQKLSVKAFIICVVLIYYCIPFDIYCSRRKLL